MKKSMWIFLGTIILMNAPHLVKAVGCPNGPDHWFNAVVQIDSASLPAGITGESVEEDYGIKTVYLTNATTVPLIINPPNYVTDAATIPLPDPQKTYNGAYPRPLILKLVSGEGYFCDGQQPLRCDMDIRINKGNALLDTSEINKAINAGWVAKDDRPAGVIVPPSRDFQFMALYGDRKIPIHGSVSFLLNNNYNPKLGEQTKQMCDRASP